MRNPMPAPAEIRPRFAHFGAADALPIVWNSYIVSRVFLATT